MIILVDSSAWIEYFRGNPKYLFLETLISINVICINELILSELLPSIIHKGEHNLASLLNYVRRYTLELDWAEIRDIQLLNFKHGNNKIGISDIIIAQNCIQNRLKIITHDRHFEAMAGYIPLEVFK